MRLSKNFTLSEVIKSNTALRLGFDNKPNEAQLKNLQYLITNLIQPVRSSIGPIRISSGFRSHVVNYAIGGSSKSQHCKGEALDVQFYKNNEMCNKEIYDFILNSDLEFDQMINEFDFSWIHISLKDKDNRRQVLEAYKDNENETQYRYAGL